MRPSSSPSGRRSGGPRQQQRQHNDTIASQDVVDLFSIDSGWNVEALVDAEDLIEELAASHRDDVFEEDNVRGVTSITFALDEYDDKEGYDDECYNIDDKDDQIEDEEDESNGTISFSSSPLSLSAPMQVGAPVRRNHTPTLGQAERDLLASIPDHMVRKLTFQQQEADKERHRLKPSIQRKTAARQKTHRKLRIIGGYAAGKRILSPQGDQTRPMMDMVRGAVFSMISSLYGMPGILPEGSRWLDLFAGTGAIGIEALSRGAEEAHFVELSPWVVSNCLSPNIEHCEVDDQAIVHTTRAEDFLRNATKNPRLSGGVFDFISVCPPYEAVSYTELYDLLEESPLLHEQSLVVVEYPRKVANEVRGRIGPLVKLRDRKYGRTFVAVYGPLSKGESVPE